MGLIVDLNNVETFKDSDNTLSVIKFEVEIKTSSEKIKLTKLNDSETYELLGVVSDAANKYLWDRQQVINKADDAMSGKEMVVGDLITWFEAIKEQEEKKELDKEVSALKGWNTNLCNYDSSHRSSFNELIAQCMKYKIPNLRYKDSYYTYTFIPKTGNHQWLKQDKNSQVAKSFSVRDGII